MGRSIIIEVDTPGRPQHITLDVDSMRGNKLSPNMVALRITTEGQKVEVVISTEAMIAVARTMLAYCGET